MSSRKEPPDSIRIDELAIGLGFVLLKKHCTKNGFSLSNLKF